jgi:hypothetical protein
MKTRELTMILALVLCTATACSKSEPTVAAPSSNVPETFYVATPPPSPKSVSEIVASAKDGDQVVVTGRVGGARKVFVDDYAAFSIVDAKIPACSDNKGDECKTPWDYCCETPDTMKANALSVELVTDGKLLKANPRGFHGLDLLKTVVVQGKVAKDSAGNVRVLATGVHVGS